MCYYDLLHETYGVSSKGATPSGANPPFRQAIFGIETSKEKA